MVPHWNRNKLPETVVSFPSLVALTQSKMGITKYMADMVFSLQGQCTRSNVAKLKNDITF